MAKGNGKIHRDAIEPLFDEYMSLHHVCHPKAHSESNGGEIPRSITRGHIQELGLAGILDTGPLERALGNWEKMPPVLQSEVHRSLFTRVQQLRRQQGSIANARREYVSEEEQRAREAAQQTQALKAAEEAEKAAANATSYPMEYHYRQRSRG